MTFIDAAKLAQLVIDTYGKGSARLVPLGNGREYAVFIKQPGWFLWDWQCWTAYRHQDKRKAERQRKRPRREEVYQRAIDYTQEHTLLLV